jgi:hypothetical protein
MSISWACWLEEDGEDDARPIDVDPIYADECSQAADVAETYAQKLDEGGTFAGEDYPRPIVIMARAPSGTVYRVKVIADWSVDFYAREAEALEAAITRELGDV